MSAFLAEFEELNQALAGGGDMLADLPLDLIDEDTGNPRDDFDPVELEGLAQTIRERGVLQPITVMPADQAGRYRLRFGARRLRAAWAAGRSSIPAIVRCGPEDAVDRLVEQVIENDQRTPLTTAQMAATVARLLAAGLTQAEIGCRLGRARDQVAMLNAVCDLPGPLASLGVNLGVRTLYELVLAWRTSPVKVEAWLKGRDPQTITQAEARALGKAGRAAEGAATPDMPEVPPRRSLILRVEAAGHPGQLVLKTCPNACDAWVLFDGEPAARRTPLSTLRLLQLSRG